jgi:hypothetical protein
MRDIKVSIQELRKAIDGMSGLTKASSSTRFKDKSIYNKAKEQIRKQYKGIGEDSDRFWKLVTTVYQNMGGTF